jgi:uncharacterized protein (DUF2141 family)
MILKLYVCILFLGSFILKNKATDEQISLSVTTYGFKNEKGLATFYLFNSENTFLKNEQAYRKISTQITGSNAKVIFTELPKGFYAVSCFHDENSNGKFDTNFFGYPKEAIGFSGNSKTFLGPPKFKNAKIELNKSNMITINLWNP